MAQKDWQEVLTIIKENSLGLFEKFLTSNQPFFPNKTFLNPFNETYSNFSASDFKKNKPGQWIPVYSIKDIPKYFQEHNIIPIRAGQAEFFFYKGKVFFDLERVDFKTIDAHRISPIESYIPASLKAKFQRNENAYLNKAVALGIINHFIDNKEFRIFEHEIETKKRKRLLYGQFGKIKITAPLYFKTRKGNKNIHPGFQFEIDLVLENEKEIIIFEAKTGKKPFSNFSLLQLYYPLIYLRSIIDEPKTIRTIFIDITTTKTKEVYRLMEIKFVENLFDAVETVTANKYVNIL